MLSEHMCQGMAGGLSAHRPPRLLQQLRGLHPHRGLHVLPARQVAQGLQRSCPGGSDIASLNYILASNVWQQDHNGFTHQDPGFLDHVANKKADVVRLYLPPDANCLLSCFDHCIAQPELCERHRRLQAPPAPVAHHGAGRQALHPGHRHLAVGLQRRGPGARRRHGLLRRHAHAGDPGRRHHPAPRLPRAARSAWSTWWTSCACSPRTAAPPRPEPTQEYDALFTPGQAHRLRLPRLPEPDPRADLPAA